jgi:hypothetical protein
MDSSERGPSADDTLPDDSAPVGRASRPTLDGYEVRDALGEGGMGEVVAA